MKKPIALLTAAAMAFIAVCFSGCFNFFVHSKAELADTGQFCQNQQECKCNTQSCLLHSHNPFIQVLHYLLNLMLTFNNTADPGWIAMLSALSHQGQRRKSKRKCITKEHIISTIMLIEPTVGLVCAGTQ